MLTDAARELIERRERDRRERIDGRRPLFDTAYTRGDFDPRILEPGCEIYARVDGDVRDIRLRSDGEARGGIILEVTATADVTGDGEIVARRAFRCYDYTARPWQATAVLTEAQVDPLSFTPPDWARIRAVYRRLCREVGTKKGVASNSEIGMVQDAARLAQIIGQTLP